MKKFNNYIFLCLTGIFTILNILYIVGVINQIWLIPELIIIILLILASDISALSNYIGKKIGDKNIIKEKNNKIENKKAKFLLIVFVLLWVITLFIILIFRNTYFNIFII